MLARIFALKLFAAILLTGCQSVANPRDLDNDCGIIAAEAYSRLSDTGCWTRVIFFRAVVGPCSPHVAKRPTLQIVAHAITAFQYNEGSNILLFDRGGTCELQTKSHELKDIIPALEKFMGDIVVLEAHFLSK